MLPSPAAVDDRPLTAIGLVIGTVFLFSLSDIVTKHLTMKHPVELVLAVRYLASLLLLFVFAWPRVGNSLWKTVRTPWVIGRGVILAVCSLTLGYALRLMPVGETISIMYLFPILVMLLAIPLLREKVSRVGWLLAILGFLGVLMILRPGGGLDSVGVVLALLNAGLAAVFHLITRVLTKTESNLSLLFHATLVGAVCFGLAAIPSLESPLPTWEEMGLMVLLGLISTSGHFLFTVAYQYAPASLIAPANYMHLVWAALLSWVFFSHLPDQWTLLGMLMIVIAGSGIAIKTHLDKMRQPA